MSPVEALFVARRDQQRAEPLLHGLRDLVGEVVLPVAGDPLALVRIEILGPARAPLRAGLEAVGADDLARAAPV